MVRHNAFTMIELIFAIVIIGITVISLPMMVQVNQKGIEGNVKQEAIFASSAKMMQVLSYAWDKNSVDANTSSTLDYARVIDIGGVSEALYNRNPAASVFRVGHIQQGLHRRFFNTTDTIIVNPDEGIEEQDGTVTVEEIDADGYKYNMRIQTSVTTVNDTIPAGNFAFDTANVGASNIKLVTITTTVDGNGDGDYADITSRNEIDTQIILRAFAANIGEIDYNKRRY